MAAPSTVRALLTVHSWAGIVTGLLLFIVCFSGAIVVFKHEIDRWANPALGKLPHADPPASLDQVHAAVRAYAPDLAIESIWTPDSVTPAYMVFGRDASGARLKLAVRADDARVVGPVQSQLGQFLRSLHVFLFVGPRWIVGFLAVAMLLLIATGLVVHRKIIAELFTQRWRHTLRTLLSDAHKAAAIWGLAFHIVIAFTGAWLGLKPVFMTAYQALAHPAVAVPPQAPPASYALAAERPRLSLDALARRAVVEIPGLEPRYISPRAQPDGRLRVDFAGRLDDHLATTARVTLAADDGRVLDVYDPRRAGFWAVVDGVMEPLHFGDFGGIWLKWLYFVLGLSPAFLSLSGTLLWLDKRRAAEAAAVRVPA